MSEEQLLLNLKQSDKDSLKMIYLKHRVAFLNFGRKFKVSEDDVLDVYQDAIIAFQEKAIQGKLDNLSCSLQTFLFGIGKYMLFEKVRKNNKTVLDFPLEKEDYNYRIISDSYINEDTSDFQILLQKAFTNLGKKCKEVLRLFYYRGFTIEEISDKLNYKDKNVVKSQKSRCIKQLKEKINN